jgi:(p)ppGpp synthase/HD superfamily hydrolase
MVAADAPQTGLTPPYAAGHEAALQGQVWPALPCTLAEVEALAERAHSGQKRNTGDDTAPEVPYIVHPRAVCAILRDEHPDPATSADFVLAVALLHDVLEDCDITHQAMSGAVGEDVCAAVRCLSKELKATPGATKTAAQYWSVLAKSPLAVRQVKAADRLDNLRSCLLWRRPKIATKYLLETPRQVLPMIADDPFLYAALCEILAKVRWMYAEDLRQLPRQDPA